MKALMVWWILCSLQVDEFFFFVFSPFKTSVEPGVDASRVRVSGAGVQDNIPASLPVTFLIDTREAGIADLEVLIKVRSKDISCQKEAEQWQFSMASLSFF